MPTLIIETISTEIGRVFTTLYWTMQNESRQGITYQKKFAESAGMNIMNSLYSFQLLPFEKPNEEVLDGEDIVNNIGIQVTISTEKSKYRDDTINKFRSIGRDYLVRLIFLTLIYRPDWKDTYESWMELDCDFFHCREDIYTLDRLHKDIVSNPDITKVFEIVKLLNRIFPDFSELVSYIKRKELEDNDIDKIKDAVLACKDIVI